MNLNYLSVSTLYYVYYIVYKKSYFITLSHLFIYLFLIYYDYEHGCLHAPPFSIKSKP